MEKDQKINGFGLLGIIIVVAIVAAFSIGGGMYWNETKKQQSLLQMGADAKKRAEELKQAIESRNEQIFGSPTSEDTDVNTFEWKTYRNEKYGFEVKIPPRWSAADIEEIKDAYYGGINIFLRLPSKNSGLQPVCHFSVYQSSQWDRLQKDVETNKPIFLVSKDDTLYGWGCGHDDYGYRGFEEYNQAVDDQQLKDLPMGPFQEFKKSILPTFRLIK
ncbi:MAG TPA: hypothetical protein VI981_00440 [Candidatus Paceibacterota bacterium]|uniref:Uncharacterized protein n=1 Tax=Candidatus Yanofskybacteria bacterium RIFCSPLOWO2_01_FULL_44_22 TaxID=1802697 RepID=A0A1F8GLL6_9BACT|nr:MAG: hypothetical protein A2925_04950 [Candidatus Yanofskybacteria bacterium RIFCSPLOWO2_01_FULL_44_22]